MKTLLLFISLLNLSFASDLRSIIEKSQDLKVVITNSGEEILASSNGLSLYTFDPDEPNISNCHDSCLTAWPVLETNIEEINEPFGIIERMDGTRQITFDQQPLYFFFQDKVEGDIFGENVDGVWHLIKIVDEEKK